jgi:hypothetical protein
MNTKGYSIARKDISQTIKPGTLNPDEEWHPGLDNYNVTASHLFTKQNRKLNKILGL